MKSIILDNWTLINKQKGIQLSITSPETVFEALIKNDIIEDPFYGLNEQKVQWVYERTWIYETEFVLSEDFYSNPQILLRFYGLDTVADIELNDHLISSVKNMFRTYDFNVRPYLKRKSNRLRISFHSPSKRAENLIKQYGVNLNTGEESRALPGIPYLRKAQYSFGWDWGPILPDIGIWKKVELIPVSDIIIDSYYIVQNFKYNTNSEEKLSRQLNNVLLKVNVEIKDEFDNISNQNYKLGLELIEPNGNEISKERLIKKNNLNITFELNNPHLWWTHDLGKSNLYTLKIKLWRNDQIIDEKSQKVGIRELKLIKKSDKWGESFYFELNGIPIFAKGANWIPFDSFLPRGKKEGLYEQLLKDAKQANMNMLRVWGGGIYEDDRFYELCDSLGILVWQDFPFACAIYPTHEDFYSNVRDEFEDNIKRIRNHPSLALWCGNNEIEYLWNWLKVSAGIKDENMEKNYKKGYVKLFEQIIPHLLKELDPNRPYWPSSPSNGFCNMNLGKINSNSPNSGDSHYWSVWHGGKSFKEYHKFNSRFMSEFGFESFPSIKTISKFCPESQFNINSPIMENHQKNDAGNDLIKRYMKRRYKIPNDFQKQIILSQINQAEAIEYGVRHWRANRNNLRCMGSLYWQLNDCWPVASWSSIDYYGRWKALHYFAKRFYAPIIAYVNLNKHQISIGVVNDSTSLEKLNLNWSLMNSDGIILHKRNIVSEISGLETKILENITISRKSTLFDNINNTILFYTLSRASTDKLIDRGFKLFGKPKHFKLKDPDLEYNIKLIKNGSENLNKMKVRIKSKNICIYTFILSDLVDFIALDNYFSLKPGEEKEILIDIVEILEKNKKISEKEIKNSFKIFSLYNLLN